MKANISGIDKIVRIILALAVVILYFTGVINGTAAIILLAVAGILILTSSVSICPIYMALGISSKKKES